MTSPWYQESTEPPVDYVAEEPPPRTSRLVQAAIFVAVLLFGFLVGLPL